MGARPQSQSRAPEVGCVEPGGEKLCHHRSIHHRPVKTHLRVEFAWQFRERSRVCGASLGLASCSVRMVRRRLRLDSTLRVVVCGDRVEKTTSTSPNQFTTTKAPTPPVLPLAPSLLGEQGAGRVRGRTKLVAEHRPASTRRVEQRPRLRQTRLPAAGLAGESALAGPRASLLWRSQRRQSATRPKRSAAQLAASSRRTSAAQRMRELITAER
jgi:hypothetical protein